MILRRKNILLQKMVVVVRGEGRAAGTPCPPVSTVLSSGAVIGYISVL